MPSWQCSPRAGQTHHAIHPPRRRGWRAAHTRHAKNDVLKVYVVTAGDLFRGQGDSGHDMERLNPRAAPAGEPEGAAWL